MRSWLALGVLTVATGAAPQWNAPPSACATLYPRCDGTWQTISGGTPAWGDITGTLADQTDLQTALDGKEASGTFSGVGTCTNQFARVLNDGAAPTCASVGTSDVSNDAITYAKIQTVTDARLLGRSAGSDGDAQEITVGSGLSLSGGSLTATGGSGPVTMRVTSDQTSTSTSFANVSGLTTSVNTTTTYSVRCNLLWTSTGTTEGGNFSINGPTTSLLRWWRVVYTSATAHTSETQTTYDSGTLLTAGPGAGIWPVEMYGTLTTTASGTLAIRWRAETGGANSMTIKAGSFCQVY